MGLKGYSDHWGLVTGASSGIGAEFARQLAARGMHLVLTARREAKLQELAQELHTRHGTKTELVPGDLSDRNEPQRLLDEIERRGKTIELLVNNAGYAAADEVENTSVSNTLEMLQVNIAALTELTLKTLPGMLKRGHGGIINVSSVAGFQPVGYMGAYAASKAYVLHFSESLWAETRHSGVTVTALCPGTTRTEFFTRMGWGGWEDKHGAQDVPFVVRTALTAFDRRKSYVVPGWGNYLRALSVRLAPRSLAAIVSLSFFKPDKKVDGSGK